MKKLLLSLLVILSFISCDIIKNEDNYSPKLYMGGGKWIFYDYDIIIISSTSQVDVVKNDTVCINSFGADEYYNGTFIMKQNYNTTSKDRRFIKGKTTWEFDGNYLYCEFANTGYSLYPTHEGYFVNYVGDNYLTDDNSHLRIDNVENGVTTNYTFETNSSGGVAPPSKMTLLSPNIVTNLSYSNGSRDKAVTVRILLKFMR
jgi:hypothetical protein